MRNGDNSAAMGDLFGGSPSATDENQTQHPSNSAKVAEVTSTVENDQPFTLPYSEERFLKDSEVAERYSVVRQTVWSRVKKGLLPPPIKTDPNSARWPLSALLEYERRFERHAIADKVTHTKRAAKK